MLKLSGRAICKITSPIAYQLLSNSHTLLLCVNPTKRTCTIYLSNGVLFNFDEEYIEFRHPETTIVAFCPNAKLQSNVHRISIWVKDDNVLVNTYSTNQTMSTFEFKQIPPPSVSIDDRLLADLTQLKPTPLPGAFATVGNVLKYSPNSMTVKQGQKELYEAKTSSDVVDFVVTTGPLVASCSGNKVLMVFKMSEHLLARFTSNTYSATYILATKYD